MTQKTIETLELRITAHRILLATLLIRLVGSKDDLASVRSQILDGAMAAHILEAYPETAKGFFDEMERILSISTKAAKRLVTQAPISRPSN